MNNQRNNNDQNQNQAQSRSRGRPTRNDPDSSSRDASRDSREASRDSNSRDSNDSSEYGYEESSYGSYNASPNHRMQDSPGSAYGKEQPYGQERFARTFSDWQGESGSGMVNPAYNPQEPNFSRGARGRGSQGLRGHNTGFEDIYNNRSHQSRTAADVNSWDRNYDLGLGAGTPIAGTRRDHQSSHPAWEHDPYLRESRRPEASSFSNRGVFGNPSAMSYDVRSAEADRNARQDDGLRWISTSGQYNRFGHEDESTWESMKHAVKDFFGKGPKGYKRSDERIKEDISEHLYRHPRIDASDIEIDVKDGLVTLRGTVEERRFKRWVEDLVEECSGVTNVSNQLLVASSSTHGTHLASGLTSGAGNSSAGLNSSSATGSSTSGSSGRADGRAETSTSTNSKNSKSVQ